VPSTAESGKKKAKTHKHVHSIIIPRTPGVGFFSMVGTGLLVQSGVVYSFAAGPIMSVITGGSIFVGAGASYNVGVINIFSATTNSHHGQGSIGV